MWDSVGRAGRQAIEWLLAALDDEFENLPRGWWILPVVLLAVGALCAMMLLFGASGLFGWLLTSTGAAAVIAWVFGDR